MKNSDRSDVFITPAAENAKKEFIKAYNYIYGNTSYWALRTANERNPAYVKNNGTIVTNDNLTMTNGFFIRPGIWIDVSVEP